MAPMQIQVPAAFLFRTDMQLCDTKGLIGHVPQARNKGCSNADICSALRLT
jgi:hypothetical protein